MAFLARTDEFILIIEFVAGTGEFLKFFAETGEFL